MTSPQHLEDSADESVTAAPHSVIQIVRNFFGSGTRAQDTLFAFSVLANILLGILLYSAWKDLQTQVWLRSDSLTKENAELRAQVETTKALVQAYGIGRTVQCTK